ncbi:MAG: alkaline phosphatase D family protein [Chloroflexota bacterium]
MNAKGRHSWSYVILVIILVSVLASWSSGRLRAKNMPTAVLSHGPVTGAVNDRSAKVFVRTDTAASVVIRYSDDPALTIYRETAAYPTAAAADFTLQVRLSGLSPSTSYYLDVLVDGAPQLAAPYPTFKTFPPQGAEVPFKFVVLTDFKETFGGVEPVETFQSASLENPDFVYIGGDFDHRNPTTLTEKAQMFKDLYTPANNYEDFVFEILRKYALAHNWDDHDYGEDGADKYYPFRDRSIRVLSTYFPVYPMTRYGDWQSFSYGQAEFFLLDSRAQRDPAADPAGPDKSLLDGDNLGAAGQLEWLKNGLFNSTATWKFILTPVPFNPTNESDAWAVYLDERQALVDFINGNGITGVILISGDRHAGAMDDGTYSDFPEMLVPSANLNDCLASDSPLGDWAIGTYGDADRLRCRGYGLVTVLTDPDAVRLEVKDAQGRQKLVYTATLPVGTVDDTAYGITYDGWAGVADSQASGGGYRAADQAGETISFTGQATGVAEADWAAYSDETNAYYGFHTSSAGDLNGDGYDDLVIGSYWYDNPEINEGKVWVYYGSANGLGGAPDWSFENNQESTHLGYFAGTAGDVNGDGYGDFIVGADLYDGQFVDQGRVYVFYGSATGLKATPDWVMDGDQEGGTFGHSVGTAGDVNGDGYDDVIIGAHHYANGEVDEGRAFLYYGSADGLSATLAWIGESNQADALYAHSAIGAGDVNGDGFDDIIAGAYWYDNGQLDEGVIYGYYGSPTGPSLTADWFVESNIARAKLGDFVRPAGDVNGDGYDDVIASVEWYQNGQHHEGAAYVYHGSPTGLSTTPDWVTEGNQIRAVYGTSVGSAGDVNGDGYDDVITTAYKYDGEYVDEGKAYVYHGSVTGLSLEPAWTVEGDQTGALLGLIASTAGDVNGDGYDDVTVGAHGYDNELGGEGRVTVYQGSADGLPYYTNLIVQSYRGPDQGLADLTLDGQAMDTLDLYGPAPDYLYRVRFADLKAGSHTLILEALGQSNPNSSGTEVRLDALFLDRLVIEDTDLRITYGDWQGRAGTQAYGGSFRRADTAGSTVAFAFDGPQCTWLTTRSPAMGIAEVYVDGVLIVTVDLYNPTVQWQYPVIISGLGGGEHTAVIRVTGTHNPASGGDTVVFDGYSVP